MILKQRFEQGRTNFKDIGSDFMIVTKASEEFQDIIKRDYPNETGKGIHSLILYGYRQVEPLYTDFAQWIYTNDGQLFLNLSTPRTIAGHVISNPILKELQAILNEMDSRQKDSGYMVISNGEYAFCEEKPKGTDCVPITRKWVAKMIEEA